MNGHVFLAQHGSVIGRTLEAAGSPYPPSFDNNPLVFGWALFARLLVFLLASSTLVKVVARNRKEQLPANHPVYYHRAVICSFLWSALMGSLGDVLTYLFWNEVSAPATATILLLSKLLDALTMIPFCMALFAPIWLRWMCAVGILPTSPTMTLNGMVNDVRATWTSAALPFRLTLYAASAAALTTIGKYWLWVEHGRV